VSAAAVKVENNRKTTYFNRAGRHVNHGAALAPAVTKRNRVIAWRKHDSESGGVSGHD
jgi:hypothetical protein